MNPSWSFKVPLAICSGNLEYSLACIPPVNRTRVFIVSNNFLIFDQILDDYRIAFIRSTLLERRRRNVRLKSPANTMVIQLIVLSEVVFNLRPLLQIY